MNSKIFSLIFCSALTCFFVSAEMHESMEEEDVSSELEEETAYEAPWQEQVHRKEIVQEKQAKALETERQKNSRPRAQRPVRVKQKPADKSSPQTNKNRSANTSANKKGPRQGSLQRNDSKADSTPRAKTVNIPKTPLRTQPVIADEEDMDQPNAVSTQAPVNTPAPSQTVNAGIFLYREPIKHAGFDAYAEYLFWKPLEDSLEYAVKGFARDSSTDPSSVPPDLAADQNGNYQFARLDWSSGVRGGFGYTFKDNYFQLLGEYTFYSSHGTSTSDKPNSPFLFLHGTFRENTEAAVTTARSHISLVFQEADLLIAKRFQPSSQLLMKIKMGMTGAWFDQDWRIRYTSALNGATNHIKNDWTFQGGGARVGLDLDWHFGYGISLIGDFSSALVLGRYDFSYKAQDLRFSQFPTGTATFNENRIIPNTQLSLGLKWGEFFTTWGFELMAAYEINSWYNLSLIPVASYGAADGEIFDFHRDGNVSFHGLRLGVGFVF